MPVQTELPPKELQSSSKGPKQKVRERNNTSLGSGGPDFRAHQVMRGVAKNRWPEIGAAWKRKSRKEYLWLSFTSPPRGTVELRQLVASTYEPELPSGRPPDWRVTVAERRTTGGKKWPVLGEAWDQSGGAIYVKFKRKPGQHAMLWRLKR